MNRRGFLQLSMASGLHFLLPKISGAASPEMIDNVQFNSSIYNTNHPQIIMVFLYGGASELAGNFTNFDQFKDLSQSSYEDYFGSGNLTATTNGFWQEAGGNILEELIAAGNFSVLRTCFSQVRDDENNRSHGPCVMQNQRGSFDIYTSGMFATLAEVLRRNNIVDAESIMPLLSMEGDSGFFSSGDLALTSYLRPLNINENLNNPYHRSNEPSYSEAMDLMAQSMNPAGKIKDAFAKRAALAQFIDSISVTDLAVYNYQDNGFARKLRTAIDIMTQNPETLIISTGSGGLGGWDDHNNADSYLGRMNMLVEALRSANAHLNAVDPDGNIAIMVMGEFGRGVNLNSARGWDHGNLQSMYVLGGGKYLRTLGTLGTTKLDSSGSVNRLFLKPADGSYWFEPLGVAATIYSVFGITNPQILTDNVPAITPLLS